MQNMLKKSDRSADDVGRADEDTQTNLLYLGEKIENHT